MVRNTFLGLVCLALATTAAPAGAQLYKWVDADGNMHFSDTPPRHGSARNLEDDEGALDPKRAPGADGALAYRGEEPSRMAFLKEVLVHFDGVPPGRQKQIGEMRSGTSCSHPRPIRIKSGYKLNREASLRWHFHETLRELGYRSPREIKTSFDAEEESAADLSIIAVITELEVGECVARTATSGLRREGGVPDRVKNRSAMTVEWQVKENLKRRVVFETTTRGEFRDPRFVERTDDLPGSLERAFLEAGRALLADPAFVALLEPGPRGPGFATASAEEKGAVAVVAGRCNGRGPTFQSRFDALRQSTATIRTASGHGSGFLVSEDGFVLTNEHVVGASQTVLVLLDGDEYTGRVVAADPVRDVALVELEGLPPGLPLPVCRAGAEIGEPVYVVGTPLDEKLSLTVTRGIISQHRTLDDLPYYQTDAVINRGNSGGPAFNAQGEVIGIAVAATLARGGGGMGINYLIPIDAALGAVIAAPGPAAGR